VPGAGIFPEIRVDGLTSEKPAGENCMEYLFSGNVNELTGKLAEFDLADLVIEELPLEEIFLHYYERGKGMKL
jgi:ABC-2 type transport system ATP-binding protein